MTLGTSSVRVLLGLLGGMTLLVLPSCFQITRPTILVENLSLDAGETGLLQISVFNLDGVHVLQLGPMGTLTFDPEVIQIERMTGIRGFQIFASAIDNNEGKALFLAGFPGGSLSHGALLELEVRAVGSPGSSTMVEVSQFDLVTDSSGEEITRFDLRPGKVIVHQAEF